MSADSNSEDDLTTDAVPSPPRAEINKDVEGNSRESNTRPKVTSSRRIPKDFPKPRKSGPKAFANVINITNANGIHVGSNYNVYVNKPDNLQKKEYIVTNAIKSLFESIESVTRKHLSLVSPHINEEWRATARALNYSDGQISQFYEDYIRSGIKEVIYQLLLDWMQNEGISATVGKLSSALWETNQQDAVMRWSKNWSSNSQ